MSVVFSSTPVVGGVLVGQVRSDGAELPVEERVRVFRPRRCAGLSVALLDSGCPQPLNLESVVEGLGCGHAVQRRDLGVAVSLRVQVDTCSHGSRHDDRARHDESDFCPLGHDGLRDDGNQGLFDRHEASPCPGRHLNDVIGHIVKTILSLHILIPNKGPVFDSGGGGRGG